MQIYIFTCLLSALMMYEYCKHKFNIRIKIFSKDYQIKYVPIFLSCLPMLLVSGLRYNIGIDYGAYKIYFNVINSGQRTHIEYLYYLINKLMGSHGYSYENLVFLCSFIFVFLCFCVFV